MNSQVSSAAAAARTPSPSAAAAYAAALATIAAAEPDIAAAIAGELASQRRQLKLIASENYASPAVLLAMGNWFSAYPRTPTSRCYAKSPTRSAPPSWWTWRTSLAWWRAVC
jgi:Serine hydroxymethyltransferase